MAETSARGSTKPLMEYIGAQFESSVGCKLGHVSVSNVASTIATSSEPLRIEFRALRDRLAFVERVQLAVPTRRRKNKSAGFVMRVLFQTVDQLLWYRYFPVLPAFRIESVE